MYPYLFNDAALLCNFLIVHVIVVAIFDTNFSFIYRTLLKEITVKHVTLLKHTFV